MSLKIQITPAVTRIATCSRPSSRNSTSTPRSSLSAGPSSSTGSKTKTASTSPRNSTYTAKDATGSSPLTWPTSGSSPTPTWKET